ncbi:C-type lectin domain family 3 member A-like [Palaemon carinicauda]|uniref:C-type lectin domain family 3 member A-like n=1 Tax=Palaemon carinicauda TaxID=392227 RepID=UPI0035B63143
MSYQMTFRDCGTDMCPNDYIIKEISGISLRSCATSCLIQFNCLGFCYSNAEQGCNLFNSFEVSVAASYHRMYCARGEIDGYTRRGRKAYRSFASLLPLSDAITACAQDGAVLAMPESAAENAWVLSLTSESTIWISGSDVAVEGTWVATDTGIALPYFRWDVPEPNGGRNENCIIMGSDGLWVDVPCADDRAFNFICEKTLS